MGNIISKVWHVVSDSGVGKLLLMIVGGSLLFTMYLCTSRGIVYNSDNASVILEAQAMAHGNGILRDWYMPTDDFLTIEIPLYALGLLLGFSLSALLHILPALLYTLVVLTGGYLASLLLQGKDRVWALCAFLAIVAFPTFSLVHGFIMGPTHIGTILLALIGLLIYRHFLTAKRGQRTAYGLVLLVSVLACVGDPFALVFFVLPLILTEGIQTFAQKRGTWRERFPAIGLLLAVILSFGIRWMLGLADVHILPTAGFVPTNIPAMARNFIAATILSLTIFHADIFQRGAFALSGLPFFVNACAVAFLLYASIRWSARWLLCSTTANRKIVAVLIWGSSGVFVAFTLSTLGETSDLRYLFPLFFLGAIASFAVLSPFVRNTLLRAATVLLLALNVIVFVLPLFQTPPAVVPEAQLLTVLEEHHLTQGLGTYWVAPIATVQSDERVVMRQVMISDHQIQPDYFLVDEKWFDASSLRNVNFIVYMAGRDDPTACYDASVRSFGIPDQRYTIGVYTVLAWNTPLLTHLQPGYSFT